MKIAILGTRGIPNNHGGFEQCAEHLSMNFAQVGHHVTVYNPSDHFYVEKSWNKVKIQRIFSYEKYFGFLGNFIYDYLSLRHALKRNFDIILQLGYAPWAVFPFKRSTETFIITNMDGLDWKRSKWGKLARELLLYSEKQAVCKSNRLVSDNKEIQKYLMDKYFVESTFIPYGAEIIKSPEESYLLDFNLEKKQYLLLISRIEPENNIEMILDGYIQSKSKLPLIVVGNTNNSYGSLIRQKYADNSDIKFLNGIYNYKVLTSLRYFSYMYFHGHTVGGTNPALLEAMAGSANIAAHDNAFNRSVLGDDAFYFNNSDGIKDILMLKSKWNSDWTVSNLSKIKNIYNWEIVSKQYLTLFNKILKSQ